MLDLNSKEIIKRRNLQSLLTSRQVRSGLASNVRAMIAAAMGALALVPVCLVVHLWCRSVVTICLSLVVPEL